jgi:hypothetical protein
MTGSLRKHIASVTDLSGTGLGIELLQIEHKSENYFAGNVYIEALKEIAALRAAAEQMAERLRAMRQYQKEVPHDNNKDALVYITWINLFDDEDAAALAEWERVSK